LPNQNRKVAADKLDLSATGKSFPQMENKMNRIKENKLVGLWISLICMAKSLWALPD